MCATREMPQATKRPAEASAPATWARASGASVPHTWLTLTPTFSNTAPRISRDSPPPSRRWPSGLAHVRRSKRCTGSNASNARHSRSCRSRKYAVAAAARSGLAVLMDVVDQACDGIRVGFLPDAVAEIEDMPRCLAGLREHRIDVALELLGRGEQRRRIQISLHGLGGAEGLADLGEPRAPVDADDVDVQVPDRSHQCCALVDVVDEGHAGVPQARGGAAHGGEREALELRRPEQ